MSTTITSGFITDKIGGITVNGSLPCNSANYNNRSSRAVGYIVMHYTGNSKDTAKANANYFNTGGRDASAHFFVDDTNIYQSVELRDVAWHCGTSGTYYHPDCRNENSFSIEMCCTAGDYKISEKTRDNAAELCAYLCKMLGISAAQVDEFVLRHYDITHKSCPAQMAADSAEWTEFKTAVKNILGGATGAPAPTNPAAGTPASAKKIDVTYQIWDDVKNAWLPNVKNTEDYAGLFGHDVCAVYASLSGGNITYAVHTKGGKWLPAVKNRTDYAGLFNKPIDALMMKTDTGKTVKYRVHLRKSGKWLPWVTGYNSADSSNGYAGIIGMEIDAVQIELV